MKVKSAIVGVLLGLFLVTGMAQQYLCAKTGKPTIAPAKIAVVSIRRVFENSRKHAQWQEKIQAENKTFIAELEKLSKEIAAIRADMDTRKVASSDHLDLMRQSMEKNATLEAKENFYKQDIMMKEQRWTEQLYQEILAATGVAAKQKGLDMVLVKSEPQFPSVNASELMLTVRTNQVLYHTEQMDITNDVLMVLDGLN